MNPNEALLKSITHDPRYQANLDWGAPRPGHPEGSIRAHIAELEHNLERLRPRLSDDEYWKLKLLIHVHDTFKPDANPNVAIAHPDSHASLARAFLSEFTDHEDLLAMVQYHDESYALWRQVEARGTYDHKRLNALLDTIHDWNLFLAFLIIDGSTAGKSRAPLRWLLNTIGSRVSSTFGSGDILETE